MIEIFLLTTTQIIVYVFLGVLALILSGFAFLLFKSISDHRKYHNTALPSLEKEEEVVYEESAFDLDDLDDTAVGNAFEIEDEESPLFDFGIDLDEDNGSSSAIFEKEEPRPKKRGLFGKKKKAESAENDTGESLIEDLPHSPWSGSSIEKELEETPYEHTEDEGERFPEKAPADLLNLDSISLPRIQSNSEEESSGYKSRAIDLTEEEEDDFSPVLGPSGSAFGEDGLQNFELRETQKSADSEFNQSSSVIAAQIRLPLSEELEESGYTGKRRRSNPSDETQQGNEK